MHFDPLKELTGASDGLLHWSVDQISSDLARNLTAPAFAGHGTAKSQEEPRAGSWANFADDLTDFFAWTLSLPKANPLAGSSNAANMASPTSSSAQRLRRVIRRWGNFRSG